MRLLGIGIVISIILAAFANAERPLRFIQAVFVSFAGVVLPLFIFVFSAFLTPDSKSECVDGWQDCFYTGKLVLTPLALLASAALYALEVIHVTKRTARWIVIGIFLGAIIAVVCLAFGLLFPGPGRGYPGWMAVPLYVAVWYSWRASQLIYQAKFGMRNYIFTLAGSLPFWIIGWLWTKSTYISLPETASNCFVVTAASRGHETVVGPLVPVTRRGRKLHVNQQLLIFWQFEAVWQKRFPGSHRSFRRFYNRVGPLVARRLTSPWLADAAYLMLKPCEWTVQITITADATLARLAGRLIK